MRPMSKLAYPLTIRSHHLLCMLGFRRLGYSSTFVSNMRSVVEELRSDCTLALTLVAGCDVICAACPHKREGKCLRKTDSEAKSVSLDLKILAKLGFEPGTQVSFCEALERVKERIRSEDMAEFCSDCEWWGLGYCVAGLERLKARLNALL